MLATSLVSNKLRCNPRKRRRKREGRLLILKSTFSSCMYFLHIISKHFLLQTIKTKKKFNSVSFGLSKYIKKHYFQDQFISYFLF